MSTGGLPRGHKDFHEHFIHALYENTSSELAPFGSDEGYDTLLEWLPRATQLSSSATLADILQGDADELYAGVDEGDVDSATFVVSGAFTLLRLTGQVDPGGCRQALRALDCLAEAYGWVPELRKQRQDLQSWCLRHHSELGPCFDDGRTVADHDATTQIDSRAPEPPLHVIYDAGQWPAELQPELRTMAGALRQRVRTGSPVILVPGDGGRAGAHVHLIDAFMSDCTIRLELGLYEGKLPSLQLLAHALLGAKALREAVVDENSPEETAAVLEERLGHKPKRLEDGSWLVGDQVSYSYT